MKMEKSIHLPRYKQFLELLRKKRKEAGVLQAEVAAALDTDQSVYSKLETGDRRIDLIQLETICKAIGISLTDFIAEFEKLR